MTPQFKTELQELIDDAAEKYAPMDPNDGHTSALEQTAFRAGCEFLIPLIESLIVTRDNFVKDRETEYSDMVKLIENHDRALLNLLRGVSDKA